MLSSPPKEPSKQIIISRPNPTHVHVGDKPPALGGTIKKNRNKKIYRGNKKQRQFL